MSELTYTNQNGYLIPNLMTDTKEEEPETLTRFGRTREKYLMEHRKGFYTAMLLKGTLWTHLTQIDQTANEQMDALTAELAAIHKSVAEYVREFDYKYQTNDRDNTSIGCDNYYSVEFDETADTTDGYDGINRYSNEVFSSAAQYSMPSDQTLVLLARSKNRDRMVVFNITKSDDVGNRIVSVGRLASFSIRPKLDGNGEYTAGPVI